MYPTYLLWVAGSLAALVLGLFLVYRFNFRDIRDAAGTTVIQPAHPWAAGIGLALTLVALPIFYILTTDTSSHATLRNAMGLAPRFTVYEAIATGDVDKATGKVTWTPPSGRVLWVAILVTDEKEKVNTHVVSGDIKEATYVDLKSAKKVELFYGVPEGPSAPLVPTLK